MATSFRRAPQAVLTVDERWRLCGAAACPTGSWLTDGAEDGDDLWSSLDVDWMDRPAEALRDELAHGAAHAEVLVHCAPPDGRERWLEITLRPLAGAEQQLGFDVLLRDVTERISTRAALEAERDRREAIVAHSSDAILFFRPDCTIEWASPSTSRLFGMHPDELVGRNGVDLIHPDDRDRAFLAFAAMEKLGSEARVEFRYIAPDGSVRWIDEVATNLVEDPHVGSIVANLRDVTERRLAEEQLALQARLLDAVGQAVVAVDNERTVIYWNEAATGLYGWTKDDAIGRPISELVRPAPGWEQAAHDIVGDVSQGDSWAGEFWVEGQDRTPIPVMVTDTPVYDADGRLMATLGISTDLSERIRSERLQTHLSAIVTSSSDAILSSSIDGVVTTWNDGATAMFGYRADEIVGRATRLLVPDDQVEAFSSLMQVVAAGGSVRDHETVRRRADGSTLTVSLSLSPIRDRTGQVVEVSAIVRDITERRAAQDELEQRSLHDPLTGLANRDLLLRRLREELRPVEGPPVPVAIAFLDLDHFNLVNDSLGHAAGDRLLVSLGARLSSATAEHDHVGRFGGDEFVVMRPRCDPDALDAFAEELRRAVDAPFEIDGRQFFLTASVGVCSAWPGDDPEVVLDNADAAMYAAKAQGPDRVARFDDTIRKRGEQRLELATALRWAVERDQLRVVYQPVVSTADGRVRGFEALVRWQHPERGPVGPDEFIPTAEATGLIVPIGEWVMRTAVRQLAAWHAASPDDRSLWMSINLSGRQLEHPELVATAHTIVAEAGLSPRMVHLEVTESLLMDAGGQWLPTIRSLRSLGFPISIDDFGTGYSSLSYLKELPVDTLKIDRSFVSGLGTDERDRSIARAVVELATALDLQVIAEGVEDEIQADVVRALGCTLAQGYHWGRPAPAEDIDLGLAPRRRAGDPSSGHAPTANTTSPVL